MAGRQRGRYTTTYNILTLLNYMDTVPMGGPQPLNSSPNNKNMIIIGGVVVIILIIAAFMFLARKDDESDVINVVAPGGASPTATPTPLRSSVSSAAPAVSGSISPSPVRGISNH